MSEFFFSPIGFGSRSFWLSPLGEFVNWHGMHASLVVGSNYSSSPSSLLGPRALFLVSGIEHNLSCEGLRVGSRECLLRYYPLLPIFVMAFSRAKNFLFLRGLISYLFEVLSFGYNHSFDRAKPML